MCFIDEDIGWVVGSNGLILHTNNGGSVGLTEVGNLSSFLTIYPNPAKDYMYVKSNVDHSSFFLYNSTGEIIIERNIQIGLNKVSFPDLPLGIYFWQSLSNSNQAISGKVIITN